MESKRFNRMGKNDVDSISEGHGKNKTNSSVFRLISLNVPRFWCAIVVVAMTTIFSSSVDGSTQVKHYHQPSLNCNTVDCNTIKCHTIDCNTIDCNTINSSTIDCNTINCNTITCREINCNVIIIDGVKCDKDALLRFLHRR